MSPRVSDLLIMVPLDGAHGRALEQLEMNYLHYFKGRALKFMVNVILIMSCTSFAACAVRIAAGQANNINSCTKIPHEAMHHINTLHPTSSNSHFHANFVSYKLSSLHFGATWCTTTCCASALPRARRLQMASLTAQTTLIPPIPTLTSVIQRRKRVAQYVGMHVSAVAAAGTCA